MNELHVDSVRKSYGFNDILTSIFINCEQGEIIGLFGRNGCGKSTLLKIIAGHLSAENRFLRVNERVCQNLIESHELIKYLPQGGFLPSHLSINTILNTFLEPSNREKVVNLDFVKDHLNKKCSDISFGEKRMIEIAIILFSNAPFILLDEPFNGLAPLHKEKIKKLIKHESQYKGIILTDHDYRNVLDLSTRNVLLINGQIYAVKEPSDLQDLGYLPAE